MESLLRDAKANHDDIPSSLKEQIVLEHTPLIRYIVNRIAARLPSLFTQAVVLPAGQAGQALPSTSSTGAAAGVLLWSRVKAVPSYMVSLPLAPR